MSEKNNKNILYCSFCGKSQHEVRKLIAGPTVFICDECVELCMDIIKEESKETFVKHQDGLPSPTEICSVLDDYVIGQAASMGSFLLAAGTKGKRFSLPNSRIMVHQPSAGFQGQATDIEIHANEVLSLKKRLNEIYSHHTNKSVDEIKSALERDNFMTPENAKDFGLIDKVVVNRQ